jgi:lipopolysaccharide export system protein LptA
MAVSNVRQTPWRPVLLLSMALALATDGAFCAVRGASAPGQPITLDAQSFDGAGNNLLFRKIRISQGAMSISADVGQAQGQGTTLANGPNFDNSLWTFRGNVKITMDKGQLNSDEAEIRFLNQQFSKAVANGKPAVFEERIEKTGKLAQGHADTIDYDAGKGIVRLLTNAWLSNGDTEIRGESLKYNMAAQSIVAEGAEPDSQRVHVVITPQPAKP